MRTNHFALWSHKENTKWIGVVGGDVPFFQAQAKTYWVRQKKKPIRVASMRLVTACSINKW